MKEFLNQKAVQLAVNQQIKKANRRVGLASRVHEFDETISTKLAVRLTEIDLRDHLPNYRFLQLIEQNTYKWLQATTLIEKCNFSYWLMAAQQVVYLQQLKPTQPFYLDSQVIGWDEKYIYQLHTFYANENRDQLAAAGVTKIVAINKKGRQIAPTKLFAKPAQKPTIINAWLEAQAEIKAFFAV